jgi:hypothetical protein
VEIVHASSKSGAELGYRLLAFAKQGGNPGLIEQELSVGRTGCRCQPPHGQSGVPAPCRQGCQLPEMKETGRALTVEKV